MYDMYDMICTRYILSHDLHKIARYISYIYIYKKISGGFLGAAFVRERKFLFHLLSPPRP